MSQGVTKCFDCIPPVAPKTFPVCTIRNTPSEPVHCVVWAKSYLFPELFGISEESTTDVDWSEDAGSREDIEKLRKEAAELHGIRAAMDTSDFPRKVFEKVFNTDIKRMSLEGETWKKRKPPAPLDFDQLNKEAAELDPNTIIKEDQKTWSCAESFAVFTSSLSRLSRQMKELKSSSNGDTEPILSFDKDDEDTLNLVVAASNLRSHIFNVPIKSKFDIKRAFHTCGIKHALLLTQNQRLPAT